MREPHYGCKDMAWGCVQRPFVKKAEEKIGADVDQWVDSYPIWVSCCLMIPFDWLFRGRKFPDCKEGKRKRWEHERRKRWRKEHFDAANPPPHRQQIKYVPTRLSPCSVRPRRAEDNISNLDLDPRMGLEDSVLGRLPLEVRQEIYGYVFGHQKNSLILVPFKVRAVPEHECWQRYPHLAELNGRRITRDDKRFWPERPALLRTCRQVYIEAVHILYTRSAFVITHQEILLRFAKTTSAQNFNSIRNLCISIPQARTPIMSRFGHLYSPSESQRWRDFWTTVAGIECLRTLEVDLCTTIDELDEVSQEEGCQWVIGPIKKLRGLRRFRLDFRIIKGSGIGNQKTEVPLEEATKTLVREIEAAVLSPV
ncbi:MAG: hypothetical protein Q9207_005257 [Kuettlingeria erythrocarpa]